jgi:hypothetical protein
VCMEIIALRLVLRRVEIRMGSVIFIVGFPSFNRIHHLC